MQWLPLGLAIARGLHLAALLSLFGALMFETVVVPRATAPRLVRIIWLSLLGSFLSAAIWLPFQAAAMAGIADWSQLPPALSATLFATHFGHALLLRMSALLAVGLLLWVDRGMVASLLSAALALALQSRMGHAAVAESDGMLFAEMLHVLAAGAWLGGLLPLWLVVAASPAAAISAARRFSPLGLACVVTLAATAPVQGWALIGGWGGLLGTPYGQIALGKIALLLLLLALAAANRFVLTPMLAIDAARARGLLRLSIAAETVLGLCVVFAAAGLATLPPGAHEQPDWPFAVRPSLEALIYPFQRREVTEALSALIAAALLLALGLWWRRIRWPAVALAAALCAIAPLPRLGLLLVAANPTSFQRSPVGFTTASIVHGAGLFRDHCAGCHGADARGPGPTAALLQHPPPDLTADGTQKQSDGDLFWQISHGIGDPASGPLMPGFAERLAADDRWDLITYLRAHAAGTAMAEIGEWPDPVAAPALVMRCGDGESRALDDLRGRAVWVIASEADDLTRHPLERSEVTTLLLTRHVGKNPSGACVADASDAWSAFAVLAGMTPDALTGTEFLVDRDGWLRAMRRPDDRPRWSTPDMLLAALRQIANERISADSGHHH
jgi:putative copper export protein/mono/diheme cytochrome c family protein